MSNSVRPHGLQPTRLLHPWDFPGKSTGVGCHCLLHLVWSSSLLISPSVSMLSSSLCASLINYFTLSFPAHTSPLYPELSSVFSASSLPPPAAHLVKHHFDLCLHVHKASVYVSVRVFYSSQDTSYIELIQLHLNLISSTKKIISK